MVKCSGGANLQLQKNTSIDFEPSYLTFLRSFPTSLRLVSNHHIRSFPFVPPPPSTLSSPVTEHVPLHSK